MGGEIIGKVTGYVRPGSESGDLNFVERLAAALRRDFERAERFDFVVEQLDADGQQPIGRENVDDAAAVRKFARQLDGARPVKAALDQPPQYLVDSDPLVF